MKLAASLFACSLIGMDTRNHKAVDTRKERGHKEEKYTVSKYKRVEPRAYREQALFKQQIEQPSSHFGVDFWIR